MMISRLILLAVFIITIVLGRKLYQRLLFAHRVHTRYNDVPHPPRHWFFGNLIDVGKRLAPSINQHPDYVFEEVWNELGRPPAYFVDLAPIDRAMMIVAHPQIAEALAQPSPEYKYSTPKSNTLQALTTLVGDQSLVLLEREEWKTQRRRFNKGFAPAHLNTLLPLIVSKSKVFVDRLKTLANTCEAFEFKELASDLTMDVITQVAIDKDFHAQTVRTGTGAKSRFGLLTAVATMSSLSEKVGQGFQWATYLYPQRRLKEFIFDRIYTQSIYNEIIRKLPDTKSEKVVSSGRAIVHLALSGVDSTPQVLNSAVSQVKTFLFAGEDTTSTTIQWMAYYLSQSYPSSPLYSDHLRQIRERLCAEHDEVFGAADPFAPLDFLSRDDINVDETLGTKLPYTTAFIKEVLRLHPPAGSARIVPMAPYDIDYPDANRSEPYLLDMPAWTNCNTGEYHEASKIEVDGLRFYNNQYLIHRNPEIWGPDASNFEPARFFDRSGKAGVDELEEALKTSTTHQSTTARGIEKGALPHPYHISTLPAGSYRPFERGPRTCIGSNLAYMEAKIVLAVITRGFEWEKVGLDGTKPRPGEIKYNGTGKEDLAVGEARNWVVWHIQQVTSVPVDGMRMRVKLREPANW